jgi:alanyl-tRNA synthetase
VLSCVPEKERLAVTVDRTAFYPEGGGPPGDRGTLGHVRVLDTLERDGEIIHYTDGPLETGAAVDGEIDWAYRFDLMQQHSGEHIVSGLLHRKFGCDNVGFHMGAEVVTIDFNAELTMDQLREIEYEANRRIWADEPVEIAFYEGEALRQIEYRSKKELTGKVRIVTFPGADVCACCGTHVARTGEIGCIRILSARPLRGGVRVEMVSGARAYRCFAAVAKANHAVSVALSVPETETPAALERLFGEHHDLKWRAVGLENRLFAARAAGLTGEQLLFEEDLGPDSLRRLCLAVTEKTNARCAAFSGTEEAGYKYAFADPSGELGAFVKDMNAALRGRGGGRNGLAQGSVNASVAEIRAFFAERFGGTK